MQAQNAGRVTARYRRYIGVPRPLPFQPQSDPSGNPKHGSPFVLFGVHSFPLLRENCVQGGRCRVFTAINLGQRRPVAGANE